MKKIIIVFILMITSFMSAQTAQDLFKQANEQYQQEDYTNAIKTFKSVLNEGLESSELYYNLGNAYYKTNQMAEAIYHYEKALILNSSNQDAKINLAYANRSIIDSIKIVPKSTFQKFNETVLSMFSYNGWAKIAVVLSLFGGAIWMLFFFSTQPGIKKLYFTLAILVSVSCALSLMVTIQQYNHVKNTVYAIVFVNEVEVKNAPRKSAIETFTLHEGTKVKILDIVGDWYKIKIADGQLGWMPNNAIKQF